MTIQLPAAIFEVESTEMIIARQNIAPMIETNGTAGTRNGLCLLRVLRTHDPDPDAHQHKREERAEVGHVAGNVAGQESAEQADEDVQHHVALVGGAELRMHFSKELGQKPVLRHREEDAALAEQHHQHHRRESCQNRDGDEDG